MLLIIFLFGTNAYADFTKNDTIDALKYLLRKNEIKFILYCDNKFNLACSEILMDKVFTQSTILEYYFSECKNSKCSKRYKDYEIVNNFYIKKLRLCKDNYKCRIEVENNLSNFLTQCSIVMKQFF